MLEDPYNFVPQEPIRSRLKAIGVWLGLILFGIGCLAYCAKVSSEEMNQVNERGCVYIADVAITSRALSAAGVERALAEKILLSMYTAKDPDVQRVRVRVTDAAYASSMPPSEYSHLLLDSCLSVNGILSRFLGQPT